MARDQRREVSEVTCKACADPRGNSTQAGCRACAIRELARGPLFFASMRAGKLTDEYKAACRALGDVADVHAEVRAAAKGWLTGAAG